MCYTKVRVISDTHLETYNGKYDEVHQHQNPNFDALIKIFEKAIPHNDRDEILVLPGDLGYVIDERGKFNKDFKNLLKYCKSRWNIVILVAGNTEYHGIRNFESLVETEKILDVKCKKYGVIYLNKEVVKIDDYYFVGCTLWSFLTKNEWKNLKQQDKDIFMDIDIYRRTYVSELEWLNSILYELGKQNEKAVVITHYPPVTKIKNPKFTEDGVFVNHIDKFTLMYKDVIKMWICGHVHDAKEVENVKIPVYVNSVGESHEHDHKAPKSGLLEL